jgi:hypothetical protein
LCSLLTHSCSHRRKHCAFRNKYLFRASEDIDFTETVLQSAPATIRHDAIQMTMEIVVDEDQDFDFIKDLPVTKTNYGGLMHWHPRPGVTNGSPMVRFVGKLWCPLFSLRDSSGPNPKHILVAHEVERPCICIQFSNFEPQSPVVATLLLLGSLGHCRELRSQVCFRLARSPRMQKRNDRPSMAFVRAYGKVSKGINNSLIVFPGNDFVAIAVVRLVAYIGTSMQISMIPFLSEADFDRWYEKSTFRTVGTLSIDAPQLSELAKAVSRLEAQYPNDALDTTPLKGPYPSTHRHRPGPENIASSQNSLEDFTTARNEQNSDYLFKIEEVDEEYASSN